MDNGYNENFNIIWNGEGKPDVRIYTAANLTTGRPYRFYLQALNFVGVSVNSPITTIYSCSDPGTVSPPVLDGQPTTTMIPLKWSPPSLSGGCPITSYAILRNGGPLNPNTFVVIH
jgi:hypothetical protein